MEFVIENASKDTLEKRLDVLHQNSKEEGADFIAIRDEMKAIETRLAQLDIEERQATRQQFNTGIDFATVVAGAPAEPDKKTYNASSPEYRSAWLKDMATVTDSKGNVQFSMFGEMTKEERAAFTFTTANTPNVVPTPIQNRIVELIEAEYPMLQDATHSAFTQGFGVPRHKNIIAGDATTTDEGVANVDEEDEFDLLELDGVEIKKHLELSRKMKFKSIDAFEDWIVRHLADRIGVAKEKVILSRLDSTTYGIASSNVKTALPYDDASVLALMAIIKGKGAKYIYANNNTIWTGLANIRDGEGRKIFVASSNDDFSEGTIYGAKIRKNDNLADDVIYGGYTSKLLVNDYDELAMATDTDIKTWKQTYSAYSLFDAGLEDPKAMFKATFDRTSGTEGVQNQSNGQDGENAEG